MKSCRFVLDGRAVSGRVEESAGELWIAEAEGVSGWEPIPMNEAELLVPVEPTKIVCVGRNYRDHAKELGNEVPKEPLLFFKPVSALLEPGGVVRMPAVAERVDFEGELALVIGKRARKIAAADWREYVRGYTLANDVSARDLQKKDGQWTRAKGFDTFCPVGPLVSDEIDPENVTLETHVSGELRQRGDTRDFIFPIGELLAYITAAMTLEPGDLVLTGTPAGVGPLQAGDVVEVSVAGLGTLSNAFAPDED
ncbi:MAG: fumarylacetoacetate hydrolase family protein [Terracidiphilus sp.]|nr:fumarylacetoacetate hydrolase family protein [Terracidiphilus sp.]